MSKFDSAFNYILSNEGGLVDNKNDSGGITKYGISFAFLKSAGNKYEFNDQGITPNTIKNLTLEQAQQIYKNEFWDKLPYDEINQQVIANYIFDMHVNMGLRAAVVCAQKALWALGCSRSVVIADGVFGPKTLSVLNSLTLCLLSALRAVRAAKYEAIVATNPGNKIFLEGWLNRTYS